MVNMNMVGQMPGVQDTNEMAMQQAQQMQAQAPMPTYGAMTQTAPARGMAVNNAVMPGQLAVNEAVNGDEIQRQRSMQGLV
jgi:hypothetical protein